MFIDEVYTENVICQLTLVYHKENDMDKIWEIVIAILTSIGGIGAIFCAVVHFTSNFIAERLQKKYDLKLNEKYERYKANIENKTYISKTKFDAEFNLYRSLSKVFFDMVKNISVMIPQGLAMVPADKELKRKVEEEHYNAARTAVVIAQDELNSNAPFIPEEFYESYEEIRKLCGMQLSEFERRWNISYCASREEKETLSEDAYKRTGEINSKFKQLNNKIRLYLSNLDVLE